MERCIQRDLSDRILIALDDSENIGIYGSPRCGKTVFLQSLTELISVQTLYLDLNESKHKALFDTDLSSLYKYLEKSDIKLNNSLILLLDNIDHFPDILNILESYDTEGIQFIYSSAKKSIYNNKQGYIRNNIKLFELLPFSFREFLGIQDETILLQTLADEPFAGGFNDLELVPKLQSYYNEFLIYGGYPEVVLESDVSKKEDILNRILEENILKKIPLNHFMKKPQQFKIFLYYLIRFQGQLFNEAAAARELGHRYETIRAWKNILIDHGIIHSLLPYHWNDPNELKKMEKIYFKDTGLRNVAIRDFNGFSIRFDQLDLIRQVICNRLMDNPQWTVYFWQTKQGQKLDFLLVNDFDIIPVEVKISPRTTNYVSKFCAKRGIDEGYLITFEADSEKLKYISVPAFTF